MQKPDLEQQWLVAAFMLGAVVFNYPILSLFNTASTVFGIPLIYVFIFLAWGGAIGLIAWIVERHR